MACVSSANFSILINGHPSPVLKGSRGLRQGFLLSPLLFLLVIEGLSLLIHLEKGEGNIQGVRVASLVHITHLLFVDDVLLFGRGTAQEWKQYLVLISIFCTTSSMAVSPTKSVFLYNCTDPLVEHHLCEHIFELLPYQMHKIEEGFKYLVFF